MNNHNYHGNQEPTECSTCFSSMTEEDSVLRCDNKDCDNTIDLEEE